jgi:hypothetical protein
MSEMIKRVALALRDSQPGLVNPEAWNWLHMAHAAIEAMRDPTRAMNDAAVDEAEEMGEILASEEANRLWRVMIDAALAKETGKAS